MDQLTLIKVGGKIVEEEASLRQLLADFAQIAGHKVLVHGGGRSATALAARLGIESRMVNGRRITDADMLRVVTMVYGGLVNKQVVAGLQALGVNALGLTGADMDYMRSAKRPAGEVDYGFVGDVRQVNAALLADLISRGVVPVLAPLTCFEKKGVLADERDDNSVIPHLDPATFKACVERGTIQGGMIPKLENAFEALRAGVKRVVITRADHIARPDEGTQITGNW